MADLAKELKDNDVLVIVSGENYLENLINIIKETENHVKKIGYVSLNKPYNVLMDMFKKNKINTNKFLVIDCITKTVVSNPKAAENCLFVSSPSALTETNIVISKSCQYLDCFIFDSLSALLVYEKGDSVIRFVHSLTNDFRAHHVKVIFIILKGDVDTSLMKDLSMFADKIIQI